MPGALDRTRMLTDELDAIAAETAFSGVVRGRATETGSSVTKAYGLAHRGYEIPNAPDTQLRDSRAGRRA